MRAAPRMNGGRPRLGPGLAQNNRDWPRQERARRKGAEPRGHGCGTEARPRVGSTKAKAHNRAASGSSGQRPREASAAGARRAPGRAAHNAWAGAVRCAGSLRRERGRLRRAAALAHKDGRLLVLHVRHAVAPGMRCSDKATRCNDESVREGRRGDLQERFPVSTAASLVDGRVK